MTIHLPENLENSVRVLVQHGRFASVDDAMTEAARLLLEQPAPPEATVPVSEAQVLQQMLDLGLMTKLPDTAEDFDDPNDQLVDISGESLSETVIRERR
jgi:Arc/MetJ-type ribon-helix-helix transcriptional regulator